MKGATCRRHPERTPSRVAPRSARKRKAAQRALYAQYARDGVNSKSARARARKRAERKVQTVSHPLGPCGNIGCERCHPQFRRRRMNEAFVIQGVWV